MLKSEVAHERLKTFEVKEGQKRILNGLKKLPDSLKDIGNGLFGRKPDGKEAHYSKLYKLREESYTKLANLSSEDRLALFKIIQPKLAHYLEATWQQFTKNSFQSGYERRAFRAPNNPEYSRLLQHNFLTTLLSFFESYDQDILWYAAWTPYLGYGNCGMELGCMFAVAIDQNDEIGDQVFNILKASANNEHEIGAMGRHVVTGMLRSSRLEGWEFCEKYLLAAQRQEGLRQVILEAIDESHPEAFRRMLRLILEHNLLRFSATLRAFDVWFGFGYDRETLTDKQGYALLSQVLNFIEDEEACKEAIRSADGETTWLALAATASKDVMKAIDYAVKLLNDPLPERRYVALKLLGESQISNARLHVIHILADTDLRVAYKAFELLRTNATYWYDEDDPGEEEVQTPQDDQLFEAVQRFLVRIADGPKTRELPEIVWEWTKANLSITDVAGTLVYKLGTRSPKILIPYLSYMEQWTRSSVVEKLIAMKVWDIEVRETIFKMAGDSSETVRDEALKSLKKVKISQNEAEQLEGFLTRKSASLRRGVLEALLNQGDVETLKSAERLLAITNAPQRLAGLEILQEMTSKNRKVAESRVMAQTYKDKRKKPIDAEDLILGNILGEEREIPTLDNGLGLFDPNSLTPVVAPIPRPGLQLTSPSTEAILLGLCELVDKYQDTPIPYVGWWQNEDEEEEDEDAPPKKQEEILLGNAGHNFPRRNLEKPLNEELERLPLREVWLNFWETRPASMRDADGLELLRLDALVSNNWIRFGNKKSDEDEFEALFDELDIDLDEGDDFDEDVDPDDDDEEEDNRGSWQNSPMGIVAKLFDAEARESVKDTWQFRIFQETLTSVNLPEKVSRFQYAVHNIADWLLQIYLPQNASDFLLDATEHSFSCVPNEAILAKPKENSWYFTKWQDMNQLFAWKTLLDRYHKFEGVEWTEDHQRRYWKLLHWMDKPLPDANRYRPPLEELMKAFSLGEVNEHDLYDHIIGPRESSQRYYSSHFNDLRMLTARKPHECLEKYPLLNTVLNKCVARIVEVELLRGEMPSAASEAAVQVRSLNGMSNLVNLLKVYGNKEPFVRGGAGSTHNRRATFSHLIRVTFPLPEDTPEAFKAAMQEAGISEARMVDVAMFSPQWSKFVEASLGWQDMEEAVWWFRAHTKDNSWTVDADIKEEWAVQSAERTPLSADSLLEGAVDVPWFNRVFASLGAERWKALDAAAKYTSSSGGHKRAQLFADAMLGKLDTEALLKRITEKRHGDSVRALGLIPVPEDESRKATLLARYQALQEFLRTSKQFGAQRQESEKKAVGIGMENLARTAGYVDPLRLQWAMETEEVADLRAGAVSTTVNDVTVSLSVNAFGSPVLEITKNGKALKAVPAALKKNTEIVTLQQRKRDITKQISRMRLSLEEAMCRGDDFTASELQELMLHPVLAPMLRSLVFVCGDVLGYPVQNGTALERYDSSVQSVNPNLRLRIAHCHDLMMTNEWHLWQKDCFLRERIQPFKQVFRELYVHTDAESRDGKLSRRYDGHQVMPRMLLALANKRGWVNSYEEGLRRTFHAEGVTVSIQFNQYFSTPAEVEGLSVETVAFFKRGTWEQIPLAKVPPRIFSEAMRDVDLFVSVAHAGGIDPEASASTIEMRHSLLEETLRWMKIGNVTLEGKHALIEGSLGKYSIHLGSATVHRMPGQYLCIVPVSAQQRGRIFLPFADNDPKTAEVVSKVLLLAKDNEIKDPIILEQLLPKS